MAGSSAIHLRALDGVGRGHAAGDGSLVSLEEAEEAASFCSEGCAESIAAKTVNRLMYTIDYTKLNIDATRSKRVNTTIGKIQQGLLIKLSY